MEVTVVDNTLPVRMPTVTEQSSDDESSFGSNSEDEAPSVSRSQGGTVAEPSSWSSNRTGARRASPRQQRAPTSQDKADLLAQMDAKVRRLEKFQVLVTESPYFDDEDRGLVSADIEKHHHMIDVLMGTLTEPEAAIVGMRRTLKGRELVIEKAVGEGLLDPKKDSSFKILVKKQVALLKMLSGGE